MQGFIYYYFYFCVQVFAKVAKKPSGQRVGSLDLYFDPAGNDRVCDLLLSKGLFLSSTPSITNTTSTSSHVNISTSCPITTPPPLSLEDESNDDNHFIPTSSSKIFNSVKVSAKDCYVGIMPPLEKCSLTDDNSMVSEVGPGCHGNGHYYSNRAASTNGYHLTSECNLTDNDDW